MYNDPSAVLLMYVVVPIWLAAGFADWLCHRASHIAVHGGFRESLIHLLMFAEVGVPLLAAIFLEVNAGTILLMIVAFFVHEATALWDVSYAVRHRRVSPLEQHVHSFLEMVPLMAILLVVSRHWPQAAALVGVSNEPARLVLEWKRPPLPGPYVAVLLTAIVFAEAVPYLEETLRGWRARRAVRASDGGKP